MQIYSVFINWNNRINALHTWTCISFQTSKNHMYQTIALTDPKCCMSKSPGLYMVSTYNLVFLLELLENSCEDLLVKFK